MFRSIIFLCFLASLAAAQTKPNKSGKNKPAPAVVDTVVAIVDTVDAREVAIREKRQFAVYSKKARTAKSSRMKLCLQLVHPDTVLTYCVNDSLCRDPEVSKVLFEKMDGDTNYVLVLVDAFSKPVDKPACDAGHETKLFYARWNVATNKALWKQRTVSSCMKAITNMTKENIANWDGSSPLIVDYHRGGTAFIQVKFDPAEYKKGVQTVSDPEAKTAHD